MCVKSVVVEFSRDIMLCELDSAKTSKTYRYGRSPPPLYSDHIIFRYCEPYEIFLCPVGKVQIGSTGDHGFPVP